jgi:hypothetical protein
MEEDSIFQENKLSTDRMRKIIAQLSEDQYSITIGADWTISITLAHLALWDCRVIFVIESAIKSNVLHAPIYDDQLNDILTPILRAIPGPEAARIAISSAERLDDKLEKCPKQLFERIKRVNSRLVERSIHRNTHLYEIENTISSSNK